MFNIHCLIIKYCWFSKKKSALHAQSIKKTKPAQVAHAMDERLPSEKL